MTFVKNASLPASAINAIKSPTIRFGHLITVNITDGTAIPQEAFMDCSSLESVTMSDSVESIGKNAFSGCSLKTITMPANINTIGNDAFNCASLEKVIIKDVGKWCNVVFEDKSSNPLTYAHTLYVDANVVTKLEIPSTVNNISAYSFSGCTSIKEIHIPDTVIAIGFEAFGGCTEITKISLPFVRNIADPVQYENVHFGYIFGAPDSFDNKQYVPQSLKTVEITGSAVFAKAFSGCDSITNITLSENTTAIGEGAFENCTGLTKMIIPNSVQTFGFNAFGGCNNLQYISLPFIGAGWGGSEMQHFGYIFGIENYSDDKSIAPPLLYTVQITGSERICNNALFGFNNIKKVIISGDVTEIGMSAFEGATLLKTIELPQGLEIIEDYAFKDCASLESIDLGDRMEHIGRYAFSGCTSLISARTPSIQSWCKIKFDFNGNPLTAAKELYVNGELLEGKLEIPDNIMQINNYAFHGYSKITELTIHENIESVADYAFDGCPLETVTIPAKAISAIPYPQRRESIRNLTITGDDTSSYSLSSFFVLENLTLPYAGFETEQGYWPFGDYFDLNSFEGATAVEQWRKAVDGGIAKYTYYIPTSLKSVTITRGESIKDYSFMNCSMLTSITIPDSVTEIGTDAFRGCNNLENISIPAVAIDYIPKAKLQSVKITSGDIISKNAFEEAAALTKLYIHDGITEIGADAFTSCTLLEEVSIPAMAIDYIPKANLKSVEITSGDTIAERAFAASSLLTYVKIAESVVNIGAEAFKWCDKIETAIIPTWEIADIAKSSLKTLVINGGTTIDADAYTYRPALESLTIGDSVTEIGRGAFAECTNLKEVTFGKNVKTIHTYAFDQCNAIQAVYVDDLPTWLNISFQSITANPLYYARNLYIGGTLLTEMTVPDSITQIKKYAFYNSTITSLILHEGVTEIETDAFHRCTSLDSVVIPKSITVIGQDAFKECSSANFYFMGTSQEWNTLISNNSSAFIHIDKVFCYSETEPPLNSSETGYDGNYWHYDTDGITPVIWTAKD